MKSSLPSLRLFPRRGFALIAVLGLLALVTGLVTVLTIHTGQLARLNHSRTLDLELRRMIDSGVAYARLHRNAWPAESAPVTLDATSLTRGDRSAEVTLHPTFGDNGLPSAVKITATLRLPRQHTRSQSIRIRFDD
ncbi:MAG: hypothetical protein ACYSUQ_00830 [Planctomycetota bacterium]|jgi:hypothetical protein